MSGSMRARRIAVQGSALRSNRACRYRVLDGCRCQWARDLTAPLSQRVNGRHRRASHQVPCARPTSIEVGGLESPSEFGSSGPVQDGFDNGETLRREVVRVQHRVSGRAEGAAGTDGLVTRYSRFQNKESSRPRSPRMCSSAFASSPLRRISSTAAQQISRRSSVRWSSRPLQESRDGPGGPRDRFGVGREVVRAARKQHELRARDDRRQQPPFVRAHGQIVPAVNHERGRCDLTVQIPSVTPSVAGLMIASRCLTVGRDALQLVEVRDQHRVGVAPQELAGEDLPEPRSVAPPAFADQRDERLVFLGVVSRSRLRAAGVGTIQDEVRDTITVLNGICRRRPSPLRDPQQRGLLCADGRENGLAGLSAQLGSGNFEASSGRR